MTKKRGVEAQYQTVVPPQELKGLPLLLGVFGSMAVILTDLFLITNTSIPLNVITEGLMGLAVFAPMTAGTILAFPRPPKRNKPSA